MLRYCYDVTILFLNIVTPLEYWYKWFFKRYVTMLRYFLKSLYSSSYILYI
nr:MAG TPA: hypothetical protein [Caudoviricetes sp.]